MSAAMALEAPGDAQSARRSDRLLAPLCLSAAIYVLRFRFGRVVTLARWSARRIQREAPESEALSMSMAVRRAAFHRSGRVACLEVSLATVILAALHRRSVRWCIGARLMPYASHAWIEIDGRPVGEPDNHDRPYHVLLRV